MASDEAFGPKDSSRSLDLEIMDRSSQRLATPHIVSPTSFRSPTPSEPGTPSFIDNPKKARLWRFASEKRHRKALEDQGCPPCVASNIKFPYEEIPIEYKNIFEWWEETGGHRRILCSQFRDWKKFCKWRQEYRPQSLPEFHVYVDDLRKRRKKFNLQAEDASLEVQIKDQTQLQNWIEFQDYHLRIEENLRQRDDYNPGRGHGELDEIGRGHPELLYWIEQQRRFMILRETHDHEEFSRTVGMMLARRPRPLDLELLNQKLENATTPRWASPGHFVTPERQTPESQRSPPTPFFVKSPDPDPELEHQKDVAWEKKARGILEEWGCPPCCPSSFEYPYEGPLGEYEGVLGWFKSRLTVFRQPNWALRSQMRDWERFRLWRAVRRPRRATRLAMRTYVDELRERRRAFGLSGEFHLECNTADQNRYPNWIEFQDYHHRINKGLVETFREDDAKRHEPVLAWIEEQRKIMVAGSPPEEQSPGAPIRQDEQPSTQITRSARGSTTKKRTSIEQEQPRSSKKPRRFSVEKADSTANVPPRRTKGNPESSKAGRPAHQKVKKPVPARSAPRRSTRRRQ
ncbi:hypothetical protein HDK90DRAFT_468247 [Phyllosticta capitalensis]|uniref:Uncharacterized protein n=1 Tax=Phyllosticta capitalensis TaxID=121624 RepID=A0ABR1YJ20_9PEZI